MHITLTCNGEYVNAHCWSLWHCNDRLSEKGILTSLRLAKRTQKIRFLTIFFVVTLDLEEPLPILSLNNSSTKRVKLSLTPILEKKMQTFVPKNKRKYENSRRP